MDTVKLVIEAVERQIADKGETAPPIDENTPLLGGSLPIDSLDLAVIVTQLRDTAGRDPFANGFINFQTVGDLARLYASS